MLNDNAKPGDTVYFIENCGVSHGTFIEKVGDEVMMKFIRPDYATENIKVNEQVCFSGMKECFDVYSLAVELVNTIKRITEQTEFSAELVFNILVREDGMRPAIARIYRFADMLKEHDAKQQEKKKSE